MRDLESLIIFGMVVQENSFSGAARSLGMPTSTVSRKVTELENSLGVRLLERTTRSLRITEAGAEVLEYAQRGAELSDAIDNIASHHSSTVSGTLRLSAPPSISDSLLAPLVCGFQEAHPAVRVHILITERMVDHVAEGIDLVFRLGPLKDSSLIARRLLTYRHQLLASPGYLAKHRSPQIPLDLLDHRLLCFSRWRPEHRWTFRARNNKETKTFLFRPFLAVNDYAAVAAALLAGAGIGELPPLVQPQLLRKGVLVEVMPKWRFPAFALFLVHLGKRHMPRAVRAFEDFALGMAPKLFANLPH